MKSKPEMPLLLSEGMHTDDINRAIAVEKARRRRRNRRKAKEAAEIGVTSGTQDSEFDEEAYLQGRLGIVKEPSQGNTLPAQGSNQKSNMLPSQDGKEPEFDEDAYLSGRVNLLGGTPKPRMPQETLKVRAPWEKIRKERRADASVTQPLVAGSWAAYKNQNTKQAAPNKIVYVEKPLIEMEKEMNKEFDEIEYLKSRENIVRLKEKATWEREISKPGRRPRHFDENAYLSGNVSIIGGSSGMPHKQKDDVADNIVKEKTSWEKKGKEEEYEENNKEFDEDKFLYGAEGCEKMSIELQRQVEEKEDQTEFDENAYLTGKVSIIGGQPKIPYQPKVVEKEVVPWQNRKKKAATKQEFQEDQYLQKKKEEKKVEEDNIENNKDFDEDAYLSGKIAILGAESQAPYNPKVVEEEIVPWAHRKSIVETDEEFDDSELVSKVVKKELAPWEHLKSKEESEEKFDERKYLNKPVTVKHKSDEDAVDIKEEDFDENAYLAGKMSIIGGDGSKIPLTPREVIDPDEDKGKDSEEEEDKPFNETAYLLGKIPVICGGEVDPELIKAIEAKEKANKDKDKDDDKLDSACQAPFDEDAYLSGKIGVFGEKKDTPIIKPKEPEEKPAWKREASIVEEEQFDEEAYLKGRMSIGVECSVDQDISGRKVKHIPKEAEKRPSWVRDKDEDEEAFDEKQYLTGGCYRSSSYSSLERSLSPTGSEGVSLSEDADEECSTTDEAYNDLVYVGKKIPSKFFSNLDKITNRKVQKSKPKEDPLAAMRRHSREDSGINLDSIDDVEVGEHNPKDYLEKLRKSAESSQRNSESPAKLERSRTSTPTRVVKKVIQKVSMTQAAPVGRPTVVSLRRKPSGLVMLRGKSVDISEEDQTTSF